MSSRLHFFRRNDAFFWRRRLPRRVAEIFGRTHVCRSLKTSDRRQARRRALQLSIGFEAIMENAVHAIAAGRPPSKADLDRALLELFDRILAECEEWMATRPRFLHARQYESEADYMADGERQYDDYMRPDNRKDEWQVRLEGGDHDEAANRLVMILADMGVSLSPDSTEFKILASKGMRIGIEAFDRFNRTYWRAARRRSNGAASDRESAGTRYTRR